jgi:hypothetical protein
VRSTTDFIEIEMEQSMLDKSVCNNDEETLMLDRTALKFSHVKPGDTEFKGEGLRDFFKYRDLGIASWSRPILHQREARVGTTMERISISCSC